MTMLMKMVDPEELKEAQKASQGMGIQDMLRGESPAMLQAEAAGKGRKNK